MTGGLIAFGVAAVIFINQKRIIRRCKYSKNFALKFTTIGCLIITIAGMIYSYQN